MTDDVSYEASSSAKQPYTRIIQDHGTVGAVVNNGSDLSYDLSSASSAIDLNVKDSENPKKNSNSNNNNKSIEMGGGKGLPPRHTSSSRNISVSSDIKPPFEVIVKDEEDDDDDVSLDESKYLKDQLDDYLNSDGDIDIDEMFIRNKKGDDHLGDSSGGISGGMKMNDDDDGTSAQDPPALNLNQVANWIKSGKCSKIVVLCGAGVSSSAGIPDFRTPGSGLYDNLEKYNLPYPEAVFDLSFYQSNPLPFISLAKELWPGTKHSPTLTHSFLSLLDSKNLLVRNYTQNIDGLELLGGVTEAKIVECHGHFRTSSCIACGVPYDGKLCKTKIVDENQTPVCPKCGCLVKPDIVFFGESLPVRFKKLLHSDLGKCDLLIVMGTSLKVAPVSLIPELVNSRTPRVLFNRELVGDFIPPGVDGNYRDVFEEADCDDSVRKLCALLGWEDELLEQNEKTKLEMS
mmetsp:Transcript_19580/g.22178  ORF Transcript_19580/g.22178 Transcript_19580/m.22178 type:complete len:459 (-) Transcript_19580:288-1664(-)